MAWRVLVVDDEMHIRQILRLYLEGAGIDVMEAASGQEALDSVRQQCPDLIVLDLGLPDLSGLVVCDILHRDPQYGQIPVVVLTALGDETVQCPGMVAVITKPFSAREILDLVTQTLAGRAA